MKRRPVEVGGWFGRLEIPDVAVASIRHSTPSRMSAFSSTICASFPTICDKSSRRAKTKGDQLDLLTQNRSEL